MLVSIWLLSGALKNPIKCIIFKMHVESGFALVLPKILTQMFTRDSSGGAKQEILCRIIAYFVLKNNVEVDNEAVYDRSPFFCINNAK